MRDPRIDKLAQVLVHYSTKVQPGQLVRISGDPIGMPLLEGIYEQVLRAGAHPSIACSPESCVELFYHLASEEQLQYVDPLRLHAIENVDVTIGLWAETNTRFLSRVDPKRQGLASQARRKYMETFMKRAAAAERSQDYPGVKPLWWVGTQYPTPASAQTWLSTVCTKMPNDDSEMILNTFPVAFG